MAIKHLDELYRDEAIGKKQASIVAQLIEIEGNMNTIGDPKQEHSISIIIETEKMLENVKNNANIKNLPEDKRIIDYLTRFTNKGKKIDLSEKGLAEKSDELAKQKGELVEKGLKELPIVQIDPETSESMLQVFAQPESSIENNPAEYRKFYELAKNTYFKEEYPDFETHFKPFIKKILPDGHYNSKKTYFLKLDDLKGFLNIENMNSAYITEIIGKKSIEKYFIAENNAGKAELEKKIFGLLLNVYAEALEKAIEEKGLGLSTKVTHKTMSSSAKTLAAHLNTAHAYTAMAVLESSGAGLFYGSSWNGEPTKTSNYWLEKATAKIELAAPITGVTDKIRGRQKKYKKEILQDFYTEYASTQDIAHLSTESAASTVKETAVARPRVNMQVPVKARTIQEEKVTPAAVQEIKAVDPFSFAAIAAGLFAGNWQSLLNKLEENNQEFQQDKNSEYYYNLLKKVQETAAKKFAEKYPRQYINEDKKANAKREINKLELEIEVKRALLAGVEAAAKVRGRIFKGLIATLLFVTFAVSYKYGPIACDILCPPGQKVEDEKRKLEEEVQKAMQKFRDTVSETPENYSEAREEIRKALNAIDKEAKDKGLIIEIDTLTNRAYTGLSLTEKARDELKDWDKMHNIYSTTSKNMDNAKTPGTFKKERDDGKNAITGVVKQKVDVGGKKVDKYPEGEGTQLKETAKKLNKKLDDKTFKPKTEEKKPEPPTKTPEQKAAEQLPGVIESFKKQIPGMNGFRNKLISLKNTGTTEIIKKNADNYLQNVNRIDKNINTYYEVNNLYTNIEKIKAIQLLENNIKNLDK